MKSFYQAKHFIDLLWELTKKEIKTRYANALLGFLWIVLNPILQMIIIGFVFGFFVHVEVENYFLFLFTGLLPWNFFSESIKNTTTIFLFERGLVKNVNMPKEALVLSIITSNAIHLCISTTLLIILLAGDKLMVEKRAVIDVFFYTLRMLHIIPVYTVLLLFTSACALIISVKNIRFRDTQFFVQALLPLMFYATPIIYSRNSLPTTLQTLLSLNPMTHIIECIQAILLQGEFSYLLLTSLVVGASLFTMLAWRIFKKESLQMGDWL